MDTADKKEKKVYPVLPPIRCSQEDKTTIKAKAAEAGLSLSEYIRRMAIDGEIKIRKSKTNVSFTVINELKKQGHNLNQLTKNMHIFNRVDQGELIKLKSKLDRIYDLILREA